MRFLPRSILLLAGVGLAAWLWQQGDEVLPRPSLPSLGSVLDPAAEGFIEVSAGMPLDLPTDHGAHPGTRGELWSLFLQVRDPEGRRYDGAVTIARIALLPKPAERPSAWAAHEIFSGQFVLVDGRDQRVWSGQRLDRAALGLAGSSTRPPGVWVDDWSLIYPQVSPSPVALQVRAAGEGAGLDLALTARKPLVPFSALALFGEGSTSLAAQAYLVPRLSVSGRLTVEGVSRQVEGDAWLDHGWGSVLGSEGRLDLRRWALHLSDDREILCLQLSRRDGTGTPIPACALILSDGQIQRFQRREIQLEPTATWTSSRTGRRYPIAWRLAVPLLDLELRIIPLAQDQEPNGGLPVWSGVVRVDGREGGRSIEGRGRLETGPIVPGAAGA
jgi:predicted secreted hydrolase